MNAASQWTTIGWMIVCGVAMGTVFDFYRVAARRFRIPRWLLPVLDLAFWSAATIGVFSVLLDSNHGEVRMYVFLGLGIGVTGYFGLISGWMVKLAAWIYNTGTRIILLLAKGVRVLLIVPLLWVVRLLAKLLDILFVITAALLLWTFRLLLKPLKRPGRWAWGRMLPVRRKAREIWEAAVRFKNKLKAAWDFFRKKT
ncbi:spore cortex biosynthesis protein YabQ [Cohnella pontilimi]|uniref:Spore cortex biosynthesis protein YabQ n=1 Tax=Cohnella pontilimi TaxID=2564100 RepID=A0A4U0F326_9BACL|nr:spore cortex biosynthesis protein YabQ [Cohnella pontilimi]TJY38558.1 spore cortex biosynthesis protein YabQ [Cohnella pontilimi]